LIKNKTKQTEVDLLFKMAGDFSYHVYRVIQPLHAAALAIAFSCVLPYKKKYLSL